MRLPGRSLRAERNARHAAFTRCVDVVFEATFCDEISTLHAISQGWLRNGLPAHVFARCRICIASSFEPERGSVFPNEAAGREGRDWRLLEFGYQPGAVGLSGFLRRFLGRPPPGLGMLDVRSSHRSKWKPAGRGFIITVHRSMRSVIFSLGAARYAVDLAAVVRIVPLAALTPLPAAAPEIAGLLDVHGSAVPVIDLNRLQSGRECPALIGTRIVLVRRRAADGSEQIFGLLASRVDIQDMDQAKAFLPTDLPMPAWLDRFLVCGGDVVHRIRPDVLVAEHFMPSVPVATTSFVATEISHGDPPAD